MTPFVRAGCHFGIIFGKNGTLFFGNLDFWRFNGVFTMKGLKEMNT